MSNVWFTSDLHWGHKNVCRFRSQFSTELEHRLALKGNIQSLVKKRDVLWVLGDSVFTEDALQDIVDIECTKFLVIGNHCAQHFDQKKLYSAFDKVYGITSKYKCWLTHAPIHPDELRGKFNVHGHCHDHLIDDPRYVNICPEHHDFKPIDLKTLRGIIEERS